MRLSCPCSPPPAGYLALYKSLESYELASDELNQVVLANSFLSPSSAREHVIWDNPVSHLLTSM